MGDQLYIEFVLLPSSHSTVFVPRNDNRVFKMVLIFELSIKILPLHML